MVRTIYLNSHFIFKHCMLSLPGIFISPRAPSPRERREIWSGVHQLCGSLPAAFFLQGQVVPLPSRPLFDRGILKEADRREGGKGGRASQQPLPVSIPYPLCPRCIPYPYPRGSFQKALLPIPRKLIFNDKFSPPFYLGKLASQFRLAELATSNF